MEGGGLGRLWKGRLWKPGARKNVWLRVAFAVADFDDIREGAIMVAKLW